MAYEFVNGPARVRLLKVGGTWVVEFERRRFGAWRSPDAAAMAAATHRTGLHAWDSALVEVSNDILDWRPLGDSI